MHLRVAYVPEHFSTPLFFAIENGYFGDTTIELVPVIEGSGRLISLLNTDQVDIAIGLTEAFVADIAKRDSHSYKIVDTYVESPLCWAVSTGVDRTDINGVADLHGKRIGVSRIGSGSYVMSFVLGHQLQFNQPFYSAFPILSNFKNLRDSVNGRFGPADELENSDAFMWEHFTSKKYYDSGEIRRIGEIYTPWPSWVVTATANTLAKGDVVRNFITGLNKGIQYFQTNKDRAVDFISKNLDYSSEDAQEWLPTVRFNEHIGSKDLDWDRVIGQTSKLLKLAGVLEDSDDVIDRRLKAGVEGAVEK